MTLVPDGIEPVVGFRSWGWNGNQLYSAHGGETWFPNQPKEGVCGLKPPPIWMWKLVKDGGQSLEEIAAERGVFPSSAPGAYSQTASTMYHFYGLTYPPSHNPANPPNVIAPEGYGYEAECIQPQEHGVPHEGCSCGIYGAVSIMYVPSDAVWGQVNLWGKVIKGEHAHRAQYAYPKGLKTADGDVAKKLGAYGVSVEVTASPFSQSPLSPYVTISKQWYAAQGTTGIPQWVTDYNTTTATQMQGMEFQRNNLRKAKKKHWWQ